MGGDHSAEVMVMARLVVEGAEEEEGMHRTMERRTGQAVAAAETTAMDQMLDMETLDMGGDVEEDDKVIYYE